MVYNWMRSSQWKCYSLYAFSKSYCGSNAWTPTNETCLINLVLQMRAAVSITKVKDVSYSTWLFTVKRWFMQAEAAKKYYQNLWAIMDRS